MRLGNIAHSVDLSFGLHLHPSQEIVRLLRRGAVSIREALAHSKRPGGVSMRPEQARCQYPLR